ncbi:MAG: hypothetical protein H0U52_06845 [Chloroflexi bacterium]|nr:hypothetical protein [Chloroflexota bacterium]
MKSADLNDIQDNIIAAKHGTLTMSIGGALCQPTNPAVGTPTYNGLTGFQQTPLNAIAPVCLPLGRRITAVRFFVKDNATGPTKLQGSLVKLDHIAGPTTIAGTGLSAGTGVAQQLNLVAAETLAIGSSYFLLIATTLGAAIGSINAIEIDFDTP